MNFRNRRLSSEKGFALVLTLLILVLITAMVVEFAYGVYTSTSALHNWKEAQRLSFVSKSGVSLAVKTIREWQGKDELYKYLGVKIPFENMIEGFNGSVVISAEDENGKFNLNSLVTQSRQESKTASEAFKRLLRDLGFDETAVREITGRIIDWIDTDSTPAGGLSDSEEGAKNAFLDTVDELLLIKGIDRQTYEKLLPHVTVYGYDDKRENPAVNINTASIPVIMSLNERITPEQAEEVVNQRKLRPFEGSGDLQRAGFDKGLIATITANILAGKRYFPKAFRITSVAEENGIRRVIESVVSVDGLNQKMLYWREM